MLKKKMTTITKNFQKKTGHFENCNFYVNRKVTDCVLLCKMLYTFQCTRMPVLMVCLLVCGIATILRGKLKDEVV